ACGSDSTVALDLAEEVSEHDKIQCRDVRRRRLRPRRRPSPSATRIVPVFPALGGIPLLEQPWSSSSPEDGKLVAGEPWLNAAELALHVPPVPPPPEPPSPPAPPEPPSPPAPPALSKAPIVHGDGSGGLAFPS